MDETKLKKEKIPSNAIVRELRNILLQRNKGMKNTEISKMLGVNPSSFSAYCSDKELSPPRTCPDWIILKLLKILNLKISITGDEVIILDK